MKKYIKLYFTYAKLSLMSKLVYKANVFIGIVGFLFTEITSLFTLYFLVSSVPEIDGYTIYHIGFLFGLTNMAIGIDHLLTDRLWTVAYYEVKQGKLDHMFLRPLPVLFQVIASEIQLEALGEILIAVALMAFCGANLTIIWSAVNIVTLIIGIICAAITITSFKILFASLAFKFQKSGPMLQFVYNFSFYAKYPMKIYPKAIQVLLTYIVPLGLCLFFPYENLFEYAHSPLVLIAAMIAFTAVFSVICVSVWNKLIKKYESTGT